MRNKNLRRGAALLLSLVMCLGFLPGTAWAEDCTHGNVTFQNEMNGFHSVVCDDCGAVFSEKHDWEREWDPDGSGKPQKWTCKDCGEEIRNSVTEAPGAVADVHSCNNNKNDGIVTVPATCQNIGIKKVSCRFCGEQVGENVVVPVDPNAHSFTNYVSNGDATCFADGTKTALCDYGCKEEDTIPDSDSKKAHSSWEWFIDEHESTHQQRCRDCREYIGEAQSHIEDLGTLNADETQMVFRCKECGVETRTVVVEPAECNHDDWVWKDNGDNSHGLYCTKCEEPDSDYSKESHQWDQNGICLKCFARCLHSSRENIDEKPTCTEPGMSGYVCEGCGYKEIEEIPAKGHKKSGTSGWVHSGTAHWYECWACKEPYEKTEHMFTAKTVENPSCTKPGELVYTCEICKYQNSVEIPATGHHIVNGSCTVCDSNHQHEFEESTTATCEEDGQRTYKCKTCAWYYGVPEAATGHEWELKEGATVDSSCTDKGSETYFCKKCGKEEVRSTALVSHNLEEREEIPATCTEDGTRAHKKCADCGALFLAGTHSVTAEELVIPATGHKWDEEGVCTVCGERKPEEHEHTLVTVRMEPACTEDGWEWIYCSGCEYSEFMVIPATGEHTDDCGHTGTQKTCEHKELVENAIASSSASCEKPAYHVFECRCGVIKVVVGDQPLGHDFGEWTVTREATAEEEGEETRSCQRTGCNKTETRAVPALGGGTATPENPNPPAPPTTPETPDNPEPPTPPTPPTEPDDTDDRPNRPSRPSGGSSGGGSNRRPGNTTTITENPTPLAPTVEIEDEDTPLASLPGFLDVKPGDWFYDAVVYVYGHGLMNGVSGTAFAPGDSTLRGMIVTVLHRMEDTPGADPADFLDVLEGRYYFDAVGWGTANEIVKGYGNGLFGPEDTITREQLAAILYRYAQFKGYDVSARADLSTFADAGQISAYAVEAMRWAVAEGLINGVTGTQLSPRSHATRAQIATILMRFEENIAA